MGFLDNVKAAAQDLTASVDQQLSATNATRDAERHFRDLGMLTYLQHTGRVVDEADRTRVFEALRAAEAAGALPTFTLQTGAPPPSDQGA